MDSHFSTADNKNDFSALLFLSLNHVGIRQNERIPRLLEKRDGLILLVEMNGFFFWDLRLLLNDLGIHEHV